MTPEPYTSPPGRHRHRCDSCGRVWEHGEDCYGDWNAHKCPRCGESQIVLYRGDEPPTPKEDTP